MLTTPPLPYDLYDCHSSAAFIHLALHLYYLLQIPEAGGRGGYQARDQGQLQHRTNGQHSGTTYFLRVLISVFSCCNMCIYQVAHFFIDHI